jgi:plastocyanin
MKFVRPAALGAFMLALAIAALACGGDDDDDDTNGAADEPLPTATRGTAASPTTGAGGSPTGGATQPAAGGDEVAVTAADFSFSPSTFSISGASDTTITLTNTGDLPHTIHVYYDAAYTDLLTDTGNVSAGETGEVTIESNSIESAPELFFRCNIHPSQMQGTITVE